MKKITSRQIALSGLACAMSTMLLTIGIYSEFFLLTGYVLAGVALMLPLAKKSYFGYVLAYLGTTVLTLLFSSFRFWEVLPFAMFFGLHPLVNELQLKTKINRWAACLIKAVWFDVATYLIWSLVYQMTTAITWLNSYMVWIIFIGGTLVFGFYDYVFYRCRAIVNTTVERIDKRKK